MKTTNLSIYTPYREFYNGAVQMAIIATTDGEIGILADHMPMVVALEPAPITIVFEDGTRKHAALSEGFARITNDSISILADTAEWPEEIDLARAEEALHRADDRIHHPDNVDVSRAQIALHRALTRIKVKKDIF